MLMRLFSFCFLFVGFFWMLVLAELTVDANYGDTIITGI